MEGVPSVQLLAGLQQAREAQEPQGLRTSPCVRALTTLAYHRLRVRTPHVRERLIVPTPGIASGPDPSACNLTRFPNRCLSLTHWFPRSPLPPPCRELARVSLTP